MTPDDSAEGGTWNLEFLVHGWPSSNQHTTEVLSATDFRNHLAIGPQSPLLTSTHVGHSHGSPLAMPRPGGCSTAASTADRAALHRPPTPAADLRGGPPGPSGLSDYEAEPMSVTRFDD